MDFFRRQDQARRKTGILVLYFILAVVLIVLAVNLVIYFSVSYFATAQYSSVYTPHDWFDDTAWLYISLFTLLLIVSGSLFRLVSLMGGGHAVAEMASARLVDLQTRDIDEKKYINVVEEMAIAAGVPVPVLYIMDNEPGINAFVAGYQPTECVMVITAGTLKNLNRDELQGVVGHEFSHILNGDMRINVRLIAILAGILLIGKVGELLMRGSSRSRGKSAGGGVALGLALFVIGYIGLFFGRLIKAAISRQREFLADASSVQFTRNPKGIAGALFKIRESISGTYLNNGHAEDMSHMCFGETLKIGFGRLLATHPPLDDRINAVDPSYLKVMRAKNIIHRQAEQKTDGVVSSFVNVDQYSVTADQLTASVGNPGLEHIAYGAVLHHSLQDLLHEQFHTGSGAKAIIYALLVLQTEKDVALALLGQNESSEMVALIKNMLEPLTQLDKRQRLPLIDLTMPALKRLTVYEVELFKQQLETLIKSDNRFTLFEFVVLTIIKKHLSAKAGYVSKVKYHGFNAVHDDISKILVLLVKSSGQNRNKNKHNLQQVLQSYGIDRVIDLEENRINVNEVEESLQRLGSLSPLLKKNLINTCAELVIEDGIVMAAEAELLRAIAECLDCPMPPLLPMAATRS